MFKLVVLLSVAAMALAKPNVYATGVYDTVVPAVGSLPSVYPQAALYNNPAVYNPSVVVPSYRTGYLPQYYSQPGYLGAPLQSPIIDSAVPYVAGTPYQPLYKRSTDESAQ